MAEELKQAEELKKAEENAVQDAQKLSDDELDAVSGGLNIPRVLTGIFDRTSQETTLAYRGDSTQPQATTLAYRGDSTQPQATTLVYRTGKGKGGSGPVSL